MGRRRKYKRKSFTSRLLGRFTRAVFSILILTAFVLGIAYFVRQASSLNAEKVISLSTPYLSKLGFSIDNQKVGDVAGELIKRATDVGIQGEGVVKTGDSTETKASQDSIEGEVLDSASTSRGEISDDAEASLKVALVADSHIAKGPQYSGNKELLEKALRRASELGAERVIHVGDITNLGVLSDLELAEDILQDSSLVYFAVPGDRDLFVNPTDPFVNFLDVFKDDNRTFVLEGYKFLLLNNSANYTEIAEDEVIWFENEVKDADFVILSQPLFTNGLGPPRDRIYMGSTQDMPDESLLERQELVKAQRDRLLSVVRNSEVRAVIAGDHHYPSKLRDSEKGDLMHYVLGAVSKATGEYEGMAEVLNIQPEFSILSIYDDGNFKVESVVLE